tara:strand:+ start:1050 stop:1652 length:603 start_codon:yes stop_codon:yes gene_type:complete
MATKVRTNKNAAQLRGLLSDLPKYLAGTKRDHYGLRKEYWAVFARELYKRISRGYLQKSMGGKDNLANKWKPLEQSTINKRLRQGKRYGGLKKSKTFREAVALLKIAATGKVPILIDTGRLYNSLRPGTVVGGSYSKKTVDQIFEIKGGEVALGSKVPYAEMQHKARPLWPARMDKWIQESLEEAQKVLSRRMKEKGLLG